MSRKDTKLPSVGAEFAVLSNYNKFEDNWDSIKKFLI